MLKLKAKQFFILSALAFVLLTGCGGSDSSSSLMGTYSVQDINILANNIEIAEQVRVEVFFETKIEGDGSPDGVNLVVRIPPELGFVINSSELYDNSTDDGDSFTPHNIINCPGGETYLVYDFSDFDLSDHELGEFGQFGLKFLVRGSSPTPETLVGATAGSSVDFNCGEFFSAEQNEAVEVLR